MSEPIKFCTKCDKSKPVSQFYRHRSGNPTPECKKCRIARQRSDVRQHEVSYGKRRLWGPLDDARLLALGAIGLTVTETTSILGRHYGSTYVRIRALPTEYPGIPVGFSSPQGRNTPEFVEQIRSLRSRMSLREAALQLGVSPGRVAGVESRHLKKGKPKLAGCGTTVG